MSWVSWISKYHQFELSRNSFAHRTRTGTTTKPVFNLANKTLPRWVNTCLYLHFETNWFSLRGIYLEPWQTYIRNFFAKIVNSKTPFNLTLNSNSDNRASLFFSWFETKVHKTLTHNCIGLLFCIPWKHQKT